MVMLLQMLINVDSIIWQNTCVILWQRIDATIWQNAGKIMILDCVVQYDLVWFDLVC